MSHWVELINLADLPQGRGRTISVGTVELALFATGDKVVAFKSHCPHRGGPLGEGSVEGDSVFCPLHGWEFRLHDGTCVNRPDRPAITFPVEIRDGKVFVSLED